MIAAAFALLLAAPDMWSACTDEQNERAIAACTALIGDQAALAHFNRGNAWRHLGLRRRALAGKAVGPDAFDQALAEYTRALELSPGMAEALVNRGSVFYEQGRFDLAIADYDAAIALRPTLAEAWNNRSLARHKTGRYDLALRDFDETIRLNKNFGNALINRALGSLRP